MEKKNVKVTLTICHTIDPTNPRLTKEDRNFFTAYCIQESLRNEGWNVFNVEAQEE